MHTSYLHIPTTITYWYYRYFLEGRSLKIKTSKLTTQFTVMPPCAESISCPQMDSGDVSNSPVSTSGIAPLSPIRVNVALCGSVPRSAYTACGQSPRGDGLENVNTLNMVPAGQVTKISPSTVVVPPTIVDDCPSWAVTPTGLNLLQPCGDAAFKDHPTPVHLTGRIRTMVGRSPAADVPLSHRTSSRRHASVLHHPSGACFVVDHGGGHGTYIDGRRVPPHTPVKVRRGGLLRFGGKGAPSFVYKAFCQAEGMLRELHEVADELRTRGDSGVTCIRGDGGAMACVEGGVGVGSDADEAALTLLHTRINACGGYCGDLRSWNGFRLEARDSFVLTSRMTRTSLCEDKDTVMECPPKKRKFVGGLSHHDNISTPSNKRRVQFSDTGPTNFYPAAVTPDQFASDDEEFK